MPTPEYESLSKKELIKIIREIERAPEWDGHTPQEAADRIERYLKGDY